MCSAPKAPKAPKVKEVNPYQSYQDDPAFHRKAEELGIGIEKSSDIRKIKKALHWDRVSLEEKDPNFITARDELLSEGLINRRYNKRGIELNPIGDDNVLQKVFDRMNDKEQKRFTEESNAAFASQNEEMMQMFDKMAKENMEAMRMPTPRQAPPPTVQAPVPELKAPPPTPATPYLESIPTAPAPTLVDSDPYKGGTIRTRDTARQQRTQATRGASALRIPRSKSIGMSRRSSKPAASSGLNIPR